MNAWPSPAHAGVEPNGIVRIPHGKSGTPTGAYIMPLQHDVVATVVGITSEYVIVRFAQWARSGCGSTWHLLPQGSIASFEWSASGDTSREGLIARYQRKAASANARADRLEEQLVEERRKNQVLRSARSVALHSLHRVVRELEVFDDRFMGEVNTSTGTVKSEPPKDTQ